MTKKQIIIASVSVVAVIAIVVTVILLLPLFVYDYSMELKSVELSKVDNETIRVTWESNNVPDRLEIENKLFDGTYNYYDIRNSSELAKGYVDIPGYYGNNNVSLTAHLKNAKDSEKKTLAITSDEYIIAPLVATVPVTVFSIKLQEITSNYTIPTFVWFQRDQAWDYSKMPENVHLIPVAKFTTSHIGDANEMYSKTAAWVKELHSLDETSKFHFFYNDYHPQGSLDVTYGNNLPKELYDVTLISDGTASKAVFNEVYKDDNTFNDDLDKLSNEYIAYTTAISNHASTRGILSKNINNYTIPMLENEDNFKLWLISDITRADAPTITAKLAEYRGGRN